MDTLFLTKFLAVNNIQLLEFSIHKSPFLIKVIKMY